MKKIISILPLLMLLYFGCAQSYMKVGVVSDKNPYVMYGKFPSRDVYYNFKVSDSLKELWSKESNGSFSNSSVSIYGNFVFVSDLSGRVNAYNIKDGKKVGEVKSKGAVFSAPFIEKNILIFVTAQAEKNKSILNYWDIAQNSIIREVDLEGRIITEMLAKDGFIYLCSETGVVYKYDLHGEKKWEVKTSSKIHSSPVMSENILYFGNDDGELIAVTSEGNTVLRKKIGSSFESGGMISDKLLFIGDIDGFLYCLDIKEGRVKWKFNSASKILMTPAADSGSIYFGNLLGDYFALSKQDGIILWRKRVGKLFNAAPAVTSNFLIVPDLDKKIYFIDKKNGEIIRAKDFENRVKLTPVLFNEKIIIIGTDNGLLNAYEFE